MSGNSHSEMHNDPSSLSMKNRPENSVLRKQKHEVYMKLKITQLVLLQ